jgi:DNA uptake protein ComE-like DNA-binding protein
MLFSDADSIVLQIVPGIGQTMAGRVVKFRENIGGLYSKDQLLEVYGMTPEVLEKVFDYFEFVPEIKNKILINQADVNTLAKHPYINYGSAKVIIAFREQHGPYQSADDLLKIKIFNQEWVDRLKPYLEF